MYDIEILLAKYMSTILDFGLVWFGGELKRWIFSISLFWLSLFLYVSCSQSKNTDLTSAEQTNTVYRIEPVSAIVIGVGQVLDLQAVLGSSNQSFPIFLDGTTISWSSSNLNVASISSSGRVTAISEGTVQLTGSYEGYLASKTVLISGTFTQRNILVSGQGTRTYSIYKPKSISGLNQQKALLSLHGGGGNAEIQAQISLLNTIAHQQGFFVAYLNGRGLIQTFNAGSCCGFAKTNNLDDTFYVEKVIEDLVTKDQIDSDKLYSTGFSNGGMMTYRLACELADKVSGVASIGGGSGQFDLDLNSYYVCNPTRPVPVIHFHSDNDRNYPVNGGPGGGVSSTDFYSISSTISDWVQRNNLLNQITLTEKISENTNCYHYRTIDNEMLPSAPVTFCEHKPVDQYDAEKEIVHGGGHSWPGGHRSPSATSDSPTNEFSASEVMWKFLNSNGSGSLN